MNTELLDKVIAVVRDHPDRYDQSTWTETSHTTGCCRFEKGCGTKACIAGHTLYQAIELGLMNEQVMSVDAIPKIATKLLGINTWFAYLIFHSSFSPENIVDFLEKMRTNSDQEMIKVYIREKCKQNQISDWDLLHSFVDHCDDKEFLKTIGHPDLENTISNRLLELTWSSTAADRLFRQMLLKQL